MGRPNPAQLTKRLKKTSGAKAKELRKKIKKRRYRLKNEYYKEIADSINTAAVEEMCKKNSPWLRNILP